MGRRWATTARDVTGERVDFTAIGRYVRVSVVHGSKQARLVRASVLGTR